MHKRRIIAAVALAGAVAAGGSAFTATSTIDETTKTVGATGQTISGVAVTDVSYTWASDTDTTTAVTFTIGTALGADSTITVTLDDTGSSCLPDGLGTTYTCTFATPVVNANDLSIVVN